jgi:hypothetical protein
MVELRRFILDLSQAFHDEIAIVCFGLTLLAWKYSATIRDILTSASLLRLAAILALIVIVAYVLTILLYILYPNYLDHIQPTVATISWLAFHGHPIYPNWEIDGVYGLQYGPLLFLINGLFLLWNPTIIMSKLPGVLALLGSISLTWMLLTEKLYNNRQASFFFLAVFAILFTPFGAEAYWNRAEPFLVLASVLTLVAVLKLPSTPAAIAVGLLAGGATGLKIHGFIYASPAALYILVNAETRRDRIVVAVIGTTCAVIVAALPFFGKDASLVNYFLYLKVVAGSRPLLSGPIYSNLRFALFLITPIIAAWFCRRPTIKPAEFWLLVGLGASMASVILIGGKDGAGPWHLLPLVPICLYGTILVLEAPVTRRTAPLDSIRIGATGLILLTIAYGPGCLRDTWAMTRLYLNSSAERDKIAELQTLTKLYPESQMGVSDGFHYVDSFYRVLSVFRGGLVDIDFSVWMDLKKGGISEDDILRFLKECRVPSWILPIGEPFVVEGDVSNSPLLSDEFRRLFVANYRLVDIGRAYQVWVCL